MFCKTGGGKTQGETTFPDATGASAGGGRQGSTSTCSTARPTWIHICRWPRPSRTPMPPRNSASSPTTTMPIRLCAGAIVTIQTKSGSNKFHGGAYYFTRNQLAECLRLLRTQRRLIALKHLRCVLGRPVEIPHIINGKDKLFFFGNFEHQPQRLSG